MRASKIWLCNAEKMAELGFSDMPILTPENTPDKWNGFEPISITFSVRLPKKKLDKLFGIGKQRKYTYRTIRKK